jgi:antitoxin component YwqK of YwqJK toxin-antitoxin module
MRQFFALCALAMLGACNQTDDGESSAKKQPVVADANENNPNKIIAKTDAGDIPGVNLQSKDTSVVEMQAIDKDVVVPNGPVVLLYPNGNRKVEGSNKNSKRHGTWKSYYENGQLWSITSYVEGIENGVKTAYYPNGAIHFVGEYRNGKQFGTWKFYDDQGKVTEKNYD